MGTSAGAILMTPDGTSAVLCDDQPYPPLMRYHGLGLVDFAFVPHGKDGNAFHTRLQQYADEQQRVVYDCHDGDGMVVAGEAVTRVGNVITILPSD